VSEAAPRQAGSLVLVGNGGQEHVGAHLRRAAASLGLSVSLCDTAAAFAAPAWLRTLNWRLRGHRPAQLRAFSQYVVHVCREIQPDWLLSTGLAPLEASALETIKRDGVRRLNFLTDDPWNPAHRASWLMQALPQYDVVFSPRQANLDDLRRLGCARVAYLPFGYDPEVHYPASMDASEADRFASDIVFAGGADQDRVPYLAALIQAGLDVRLYGGYWNRVRQTRPHTRGFADPSTLRKATHGAKVALGLVRRANRDGHAMRSFEIPAMGGCPLLEETEEHRAIFGEDGHAVMYFRSVSEMVERARWLVTHPEERRRLSMTARAVITSRSATYRHRLAAMLGLDDSGSGHHLPCR
jgi:spore maturation protein CgeB